MARIFISYSRKDSSEIADELADRLRVLGYEVFLDVQTMIGGVDWRKELKDRIAWANLIIVLVTPGSNDSDYVFLEINEAEKRRKIILPIQLDNTPLPVHIRGKWQAIKLENKNYAHALLEIKRVIERIDRGDSSSTGCFSRFRLLMIIFVMLVIVVTSVFLINNFTQRNPPDPTQIVGNITSTPPEHAPEPTETETLEPPTAIPTSTQVQCEQLMFVENFDDASLPQNWMVNSGEWAIVLDNGNAVYQKLGQGIGEVQIGDAAWQNYALEFEVKPINLTSGSRAIADLRVSAEDSSRVILSLDFASNTLDLFRLLAIDNGVPYKITSRQYSFSENLWLKVRIEIVNQQVQLYLNNDNRLVYDGVDTMIRQGIIQLKTNSLFVLFDNIRVLSLENCPT